jgi:hypothetical protein
MGRRRANSVVVADWPPALRNLIQAAESECPPGHAEALYELTTLALRKVPARGVFDPGSRGEDDLFATIEAVARAHLELSDARAAWDAALESAALDFDRRDEIARAALQVQNVSDTANFYAGLAFGLAASWVFRPA